MGRGDILTKKGKWVGQYHGHEGVDLKATYLPGEGKWGVGRHPDTGQKNGAKYCPRVCLHRFCRSSLSSSLLPCPLSEVDELG